MSIMPSHPPFGTHSHVESVEYVLECLIHPGVTGDGVVTTLVLEETHPSHPQAHDDRTQAAPWDGVWMGGDYPATK